MQIKTQFHVHIKGDTEDYIKYDCKKLIDRADELKFKAVAFTCHKKIISPKGSKAYAQKKGILLIKGVEIEINKKHILILNAHKESEKIQTFDDLKRYKNKHKESLIIAAHPYFPGRATLKNDLVKHINLFDAIEYSFMRTKVIDFNKKAVAVAKRYNKPLIGTSDCHVLKYLDLTYSLIDIPGNNGNKINEVNIFNVIRKNKIKIVSKTLSIFEAGIILSKFLILDLLGKFRKV